MLVVRSRGDGSRGERGGGRGHSGRCPTWWGRKGLGGSDSCSIGPGRETLPVTGPVPGGSLGSQREAHLRTTQPWCHGGRPRAAQRPGVDLQRLPALPRGRGGLAGPQPGGHWPLLVKVVIGAPGTTLGSECFPSKCPNLFSDDTEFPLQHFIPFQRPRPSPLRGPLGPSASGQTFEPHGGTRRVRDQ